MARENRIDEIVAAHDILLGLAQSGVYVAFSQETKCFLNIRPGEVIRSLFFKKNNDSLITVSVYASDNYSSLKCRMALIDTMSFSHISVLSHSDDDESTGSSILCTVLNDSEAEDATLLVAPAPYVLAEPDFSMDSEPFEEHPQEADPEASSRP
ncbi:hypothetical protein Tco_1456160 [Tanacetum coccineum]